MPTKKENVHSSTTEAIIKALKKSRESMTFAELSAAGLIASKNEKEVEIDIDALIIEAYNRITLQDAPKVSIETIVETIDRWGQLDNADYWKEALNLDVRNSTPDKNEDFQDACGYVRYFSYHKGKDKLNDIDYEHIN